MKLCRKIKSNTKKKCRSNKHKENSNNFNKKSERLKLTFKGSRNKAGVFDSHRNNNSNI